MAAYRGSISGLVLYICGLDRIRGLAVLAGVWLMATEMEMSAAQRAYVARKRLCCTSLHKYIYGILVSLYIRRRVGFQKKVLGPRLYLSFE